MINMHDKYTSKKIMLVSCKLCTLPPSSHLPPFLTWHLSFCSNTPTMCFIITSLHLSVEHQQKEPVLIRNTDAEPQRRKSNR